jgi:hypothetical protein
MAYPICRALRTRGYGDVTVAHPKTLAWIVRSKKKNDRVDSLKIAKLHMAGMLPESHLLDRDQNANVNLASHRFYDDWEKWWGESPPVAVCLLRPQIARRRAEILAPRKFSRELALLFRNRRGASSPEVRLHLHVPLALL